MLASKYETVTGDVVVSAGLVTLGSAFTQEYRLKLIEKWQMTLNHQTLVCNFNYQFQQIFGDNFKIREWHSNGCPPDPVSTDNALIMDKTKRYCLCIDPQQ